jgi:hypothetical protein
MGLSAALDHTDLALLRVSGVPALTRKYVPCVHGWYIAALPDVDTSVVVESRYLDSRGYIPTVSTYKTWPLESKQHADPTLP